MISIQERIALKLMEVRVIDGACTVPFVGAVNMTLKVALKLIQEVLIELGTLIPLVTIL